MNANQAKNLPRSVKICEIREETDSAVRLNIRSFILDDAIDAEPGQFVLLWLPRLDEKPFTVAWPDPLTITVAEVGPFTRELFALRPGDVIGWRGPFGNPFRLDPDRPALMVGGGYGAAPMYYLASEAGARGIPATVALGARRRSFLIYTDRFEGMAGVDLLLATDDGSAGFRGNVVEAIRAGGVLEKRPAIYACGPERMLYALFELCKEEGLPGQLDVERYMKCGIGICGHCALDDLLICMDGPVLNIEQLEHTKDFGHFHRTATGRRVRFL